MTRKILFLFLLIFSLGYPHGYIFSADGYYFSNLGLKDGLSQISVMKIMQDSKGYLWFGTRNGLNKYDGSKFTIYKHSSADSLSLTNSHITALAEDNEGNLWIGTLTGLNKLNLKTNINTPYDRQSSRLFGSAVRSLCVDSQNRLWIGTSAGLCLYIKEVDKFQIVDLAGEISNEFISSIYETHDHRLVISTNTKGIFVCDMNLKVQKHYPHNLIDKTSADKSIAALYEDSRNQLWVGYTYSGLAKLNLDTDEVVTFTNRNSEFTNNSVRCFAEHEGTLFIGTFDGIYALDINTGKMVRHSNVNIDKGNLSHFSIYSLCVDTSGTVWVGSYSGGINYFSKYNNRFNFQEPVNMYNSIYGIFGSMVSRGDHIYMATEGGGLLDYNITNGQYRYNLIEKSQNSQNIVKTVMIEDDIVWCGTNNGHIYQFNIRTGRYSLYHSLPRAASVYSIYRAYDGYLWVGTSDPHFGLYRISKEKEMQAEFELLDTDTKYRQASVRCFTEIKEGVFLIGTRNNGLIRYDQNSCTITRYNINGKDSCRILNNYITSILRDSKGRTWVGTFGGGVFLYGEGRGVIKTITSEQGLIDDDVCAIVEDENHQIWISTNNGISGYDPESEVFSNYGQFSGIGVQEFSPHSGTLLPNGNICFSGNNGFVIFDPADLYPNPFLPPIVLTTLVVNNEEIRPTKTNILDQVIDDTPEIRLAYNQNNISVGYCALNYIFPDKNQYAYRLEGHDKSWNYVGNRKEAYYTNLSPGTYTFEVKASNNDGVWNEQARTLSIIISPPMWKTWYAYVFYVVLFISVFGLILYYINSKQRLERELQYKQLEKQQLEEFHQTKIRLFTNFSHELRTPLTLIISPLQDLMKISDFNLTVRNKLSLISSNAQRLLLLVNQLMDLRKNQSGKMQLKISGDDIYSFIEEIYYAFKQIAESKNIDFRFEKEEEHFEAWFDKSLFEKVIFNLLSNAFKYTRANGTIVLSLKQVKRSDLRPEQQEELKDTDPQVKYIKLSVADTGKGIPASELKNIFTPFYQIEKNENTNVGTGIGLSLTQSIIQLHHGTIWVDANEPQGAIFNVVIPISKFVYSKEQLATGKSETGLTDVLPPTSPHEIMDIEKKHTVLLVEDNEEVRKYVKESLEPYFFVLEADNGQDALEIAIDKYPDLVISDIMMPKMDGIQLCTEIKKDMRIGHIPVILMTAKSMVIHIKEGFSVGADDYIIKPFNIDILIYRVKNLLDSREKLKHLYGKKFSPDSLGIEIVSGNDRFTQKFFKVIEDNLANPELNIDLLSREIGLSRANLYRKLKAITELSPTELIRNKRLEIAAKLLSDSDLSISEISVHVGFNSHAYFTNSFKAVYGYSPSEFIQKHRGVKGE